MDDCLKILFRKRKRGTDGHAALLALHHIIKNGVFKYQITVHQQNILIFQVFSGAIDRINIIGFIINRIFYKRNSKRQFQTFAVLFQHRIKQACCHHHFFDSFFSQLSQLPA